MNLSKNTELGSDVPKVALAVAVLAASLAGGGVAHAGCRQAIRQPVGPRFALRVFRVTRRILVQRPFQQPHYGSRRFLHPIAPPYLRGRTTGASVGSQEAFKRQLTTQELIRSMNRSETRGYEQGQHDQAVARDARALDNQAWDRRDQYRNLANAAADRRDTARIEDHQASQRQDDWRRSLDR